MRFKRLKGKVICLVLAIGLLYPTPVSAAIGDNIGGGGGAGGGGVTDGGYTYAESYPQGYRVTLIKADGTKVKAPIDITNDTSYYNIFGWKSGSQPGFFPFRA